MSLAIAIPFTRTAIGLLRSLFRGTRWWWRRRRHRHDGLVVVLPLVLLLPGRLRLLVAAFLPGRLAVLLGAAFLPGRLAVLLGRRLVGEGRARQPYRSAGNQPAQCVQPGQ